MMLVVIITMVNSVNSQGPPITADKPIMLGSKTTVVKTLTEIRKSNQGTFLSAPILLHYLPTSNSLIGIHVPFTNYNFEDDLLKDGSSLGDISILAKYQFYRKDGMGKTFRMVAKTLQTLPTGKSHNIDGINTGEYQSYLALIAGYESIKYGISNELGYNLIPGNKRDELIYKLGFGLPLLKSTYPVKQINLYFEYQNKWFVETNDFLLLYAQGIQYAKGKITVETAIQFPLDQTISEEEKRDYSLFLGTRFVF